MKYLRLFESFEDIDKICRIYNIKNYTINTDGSIDIKADIETDEYIDLSIIGLIKLPIKFNIVTGDFDCSFNNLITLEGSPKEVNGYFDCSNNKLTSLKYAPRIIRGGFDCSNNDIKTFEYFPNFIKEDFFCTDTLLWYIWILFRDWTKIELLNDFDIFRDEDTDEPAIVMERLNDFLLTIGRKSVEKVDGYKNI